MVCSNLASLHLMNIAQLWHAERIESLWQSSNLNRGCFNHIMNEVSVTKSLRPISQEEIRALADQIARKFNPHKIVLFGSYARGNYDPFSDVDLLVVLEKNQKGVDPEIEVALSVPHKFPMDILVRSPQELAARLKMGDTFLHDIITNGVVLYERPGE